MVEKSPAPILQDIVDAIERIQSKTKDLSLTEFAGDWERLWLVERGVEIVSEASRRLPDEIKDRHPDIPWKKIAGIGNVLRHEYDAVSPRVLLNIAHNDLIPLERVCKAELMREKLRQDQPSPDNSQGRER